MELKINGDNRFPATSPSIQQASNLAEKKGILFSNHGKIFFRSHMSGLSKGVKFVSLISSAFVDKNFSDFKVKKLIYQIST